MKRKSLLVVLMCVTLQLFAQVDAVEDKDMNVPFATIEEVPIFPGCENAGTNVAKKKCMSHKVKQFVNKRFKASLADSLHLSGINRIYVKFTIDKNGDIAGVKARGPHPLLEKEARRVVKLFPKMKPGRSGGKLVGVTYNLPIVFKVEERDETPKE